MTAHVDHTPQIARLRRVEGQVRGIARMIEERRYCIEVLTQLQAARAALGRIEREVLEAHAGACVAAAVQSGDRAEQSSKISELTDLLRRSMR